MRRLGRIVGILLALSLGSSPNAAGAGDGRCAAEASREALAALRAARVRHAELEVREMEIHEEDELEGSLRARVTNRGDAAVGLCVDLRSEPGLWYRPNWQAQSRHRIEPGESVLEVRFEISRRTDASRLRVRLEDCAAGSAGDAAAEAPLFERWVEIGLGCDPAPDPLRAFEARRSEHFDFYAWRPSPAATEAEKILAEREAGLAEISALLGVEPSERITLVFYPDGETKTADTSHRGEGWAFGRTIVEVYNDAIRLDPYHELAHILGGELGSPPALFDEGLATWISERLGADALQYLGAPGQSVDQVSCRLLGAGELFPLAELVHFEEIGSEASRPTVAYPQAASVVGYLIGTHGLEPFRRAFAGLSSPAGEGERRRNEALWAELFGATVEEVDRAWRRSLESLDEGCGARSS